MKNECYTYAKNLVKKKTYFIGDLYKKLLFKYNRQDVSGVVRALINEDLLNDQRLVKLYIYEFVNFKNCSRKYIIEYFKSKKISQNIVNYILKGYPEESFEKNKQVIIKVLKERNKNDAYINNYLLRKGFEID